MDFASLRRLLCAVLVPALLLADGAVSAQSSPAGQPPAAPAAAASDFSPPATPPAAKPRQPAKLPAQKRHAAQPHRRAAPARSKAKAATKTVAKPQRAPAPAPQPKATPAAPVAAGSGERSTLGFGSGRGPIEISSDDGLELDQANKVYIARGNVVAKRGDRTLDADQVMAYYRDIPNSSQTEIWRVVADGNVKMTTPTETVVGDHGVYDLDTRAVILTGKGLKLTTPRDVVTARDSLEWYDGKQVAVARGNAIGIRDDRRLRADILTAQVSTAPGESARISRVDATGHVVVSRPDQVGTGDSGVYDVDTGLVTLSGHVTLARGRNTMIGEYGVVDLEKGVSRLLPGPPHGKGRAPGRVAGYIVPNRGPPTGSAAQKEQPSGAEAR